MSKENVIDMLLSIVIATTTIFCCDLYINPLLLNYGGDSAVFQEMGLAIFQGKIPYVDIFDHKGFLLYLIQALGFIFAPNKWGIFLLSIINISFCIYIWLKTASLISPNKKYISVIFTVIIYAILGERGNTAELWTLPFISYPTYVLVDYVKNNRIVSIFKCVIIGFCIGILIHIKMNCIMPVIVVCIFLLIAYIKKKEYNKLIVGIASVTISTFIVVFFIIGGYILFYGSSYFNDFILANLTFNLAYVQQVPNGTLLKLPIILTSGLLLLAFLNKSQYKFLFWFCFFTYIITSQTFSKIYFNHYFIIFLPIYCLLFSLIFDSKYTDNILGIIKRNKVSFWGLVLISISLICYFAYPIVKKQIERGQIYDAAFRETKDFLYTLPSEDLDDIWNFNAKTQGLDILLLINRVQVNKMIQYNHLKKCPELKENLNETIIHARPHVILLYENTKWDEFDEKQVRFIRSNYSPIFTAQLKTNSSDNILIYRRNDLLSD